MGLGWADRHAEDTCGQAGDLAGVSSRNRRNAYPEATFQLHLTKTNVLFLPGNVPAYESEGRTFESFRARHFFPHTCKHAGFTGWGTVFGRLLHQPNQHLGAGGLY